MEYIYDPSKVRVVKEGASGLKKPKAAEHGSGRTGKSSPSYHQAASKTVSRMQAENAKEHQRLKPRQLKKIMRAQLLAGNPEISVAELDKLVDDFLPLAMEKHKAPPIQKPAPDPEVVAVWRARKAERQRVVKLNKLRRKMEQPLSKEDRGWIAKTSK